MTGALGGWPMAHKTRATSHRAFVLRIKPCKLPQVLTLRASIPAPTSKAWSRLRRHHQAQGTDWLRQTVKGKATATQSPQGQRRGLASQTATATPSKTALRGQRPTGRHLPGGGKCRLVGGGVLLKPSTSGAVGKNHASLAGGDLDQTTARRWPIASTRPAAGQKSCQRTGRQNPCQLGRWHGKFRPAYTFVYA